MPSPIGSESAAPFTTFYLFATAMAAGIPALLPLVPLTSFGRRYFVLMTLVAVVFVALAVGAVGVDIGYAYLAMAALLITYNVVLPRQSGVDWSERRERAEGGARPALTVLSQVMLVAAAMAGATGVVQDAMVVASGSRGGAPEPLLVAGFLASSLLLGGSVVAMTLGHWYLVSRKLSFIPLARMTLILGCALVARLVVVAASAWAQADLWQEMVDHSGMTTFLIDPGMFVLARVLFGLLAPVPLLWMARRCVAIEANQSATGILYVTVAFVIMGEIIAKYLLVSKSLLI